MSFEHISTDEILKDLSDTEAEIIQMEKEEKSLRVFRDRLSHMKADARLQGIRERKIFIEKLKVILKERNE